MNQDEFMGGTAPAISLSRGDLLVLAAMRHGLQTHVAGEVTSPMAQTMCQFSVLALDQLIARHGLWPEILAPRIAAQARTIGEIARLLRVSGAIAETDEHEARQLADRLGTARPARLDDCEAAQRALDAMLERLAGPLMKARANGSSEADALFQALSADFVTAQSDLAAASAARIEAHAARAEAYVTVTRAGFEAYLRRRFPDRPDLAVTAYAELPGGSSKTTLLVDLRGFEHDGITPIVVRLDRTGGSTDTHALDEAPIVAAAHRLGFPVPELLWCEPDAGEIGHAFIVFRKVGGVPAGGMMGAVGAHCGPEVARQLAAILARLHAVDPAEFGLTVPDEHPMLGALARVRRLQADNKLEPNGLLECCMRWLEENLPPPPERAALVHGDVSAHNLLIDGERVEAILDWELFHVGDPLEDLANTRASVKDLLPWEEFVAEYERHGGAAYSEAVGHYYGVWSAVRNVTYTLLCRKAFHSGLNPDLRWSRYASYGTPLLTNALLRIAQAEAAKAAPASAG